MRVLWQDLRYAVRMLAKSPAFTVVAVVSLAVGMGANTAIFSVANRLLFQPLPLVRAEELVSVHKHTTENEGQSFPVSYPDYQFYRDHSEVFAGLMCWGELPLSLSDGERAEQAFGMIVSGNYFDVLGVRPALGRFFMPEEDRTPGTHPVAVLSYGMWQRRFGAAPDAVGRTITLNGHPFEVVGVAPRGFNSTVPLFAPDVWVPVMMQGRALASGGEMLATRDARWLHMVGRLRADVTREQAEARVSGLALALAAEHPEERSEEEQARLLGVTLAPVGSFPVELRRGIMAFIGMMLGVAGLVLLIACANLSSLLLARATARRREIAVRLALGAGRLRIIRQLLTESVLLCLLGGVAGVLLALWLTDLLLTFKPPVPVPLELSFPLDGRVLGGAFALSLLTGILFGLLPALEASRQDLTGALKDDPLSGRAVGRSRARDLFVVGQVAMSLLLLVSAGLLLRSLAQARTSFPGADPEQVLTVTLDPGVLGYDGARARDFYLRLAERVGAVPGFESAGLADGVPAGNAYSMSAFIIKGRQTMSGLNHVSPEYFQTMRIPILRGRGFRDSDREGSTRVAVIDETLARRFFPDEDPLGKHVVPDADPQRKGTPVEIVGIVRGGADREPGRQPNFFIYLPTAQPIFGEGYTRRLILHVRTNLPQQEAFEAIRREVGALDPDVPLLAAMPLTEQMRTSLLPERLGATVAGVFGLVGVALAAVGIFGLLSYTVTQRTHEIGVRMALGAQRADVLALVLRRGLKVTLAGLFVGLLASLAVTRLLTGLLHGVSAADPLVYAGVSLMLLLVALLACYVPARRATKVDPLEALRYE